MVMEEIGPMWESTTFAGTQTMIQMGFGAQSAQMQPQAPSAPATCQSAIQLSPQERQTVWTGKGGGLIGSGILKFQLIARVSQNP